MIMIWHIHFNTKKKIFLPLGETFPEEVEFPESCCCCLRPFTRFDIEKNAVLALFVVAPFVEACETFEGVGGDILEGVAGCRGRTIPPPGGKMLDAGGGGRERSIKDSVIMMEIEINRFSINTNRLKLLSFKINNRVFSNLGFIQKHLILYLKVLIKKGKFC